MYPNPTKNRVYLKSNKNITDLRVNIYNVLGKKLISKKISSLQNNSFEIDTSNLNVGIYFVEITNKKVTNIQKLIIE